jgi:Fusaric acid resistance protein family
MGDYRGSSGQNEAGDGYDSDFRVGCGLSGLDATRPSSCGGAVALSSFCCGCSRRFYYLLSDAQLADGWRQVQLFFVNTFWIVIFDPEGFGWSVGYNFGGALVAFGLIVLFDNVLWPDPSESELLCSLEASLKSIRVRFILIGRDYLSPSGSVALPHPSTICAMGNHLTLLARAEREGISRGRYAVLFSAVSSTERLRLEVERMLAIARERVPRGIRQLVQPELQGALVAIDSGLQTGAADLAVGLTEERGSYDISRPVASALEAYSRRENELHAQFLISRADELSNLSAFVNCLHRMAELLIRNPSASRMASDVIAKEKVPRSRPDSVRIAYCLKLTAATAAAFIVGLTAHRSDLTVILWTVILAALPTFGASLRKMILRLVGAAIGGLMGLAAIIVISPNFETVLTYMLVCFIVLVACAYVAAGGITIAYAGLQAGVTFLLLFVDLSPSIREYEALWRLWGIFLGLIIVGGVFLLMWPEYAGDSMTPRLRRILRIAFDLTPKRQQDGSVQRVRDLEMEACVTMTQLFAVADDARLEGRRSGIDPDRLVDAVGTLRRMVHRLGEIGESRFSAPHPPLSVEAQAADEALGRALGNRFQSWLDEFERNGRLDGRRAIDVAASRKPDDLRGPLQHFEQRVSASNFAEIELWPDKARRALLARMESWRRLAVLADELDHQLANVSFPRPA